MKVTALKTSLFKKTTSLMEFLKQHTSSLLKEKSILAITSKILSLAEGRVVSKSDTEKTQLIKQEADYDLGPVAYGCHLTIKHGHLLPSAGIDESNSSDGEYILYPENPFSLARQIRHDLKTAFSLKELGVIITDSRTLPLKAGVVGMALSYSGFVGVKNMVGQKDLFGSPLKMTRINVAEALASSAVLLMGEGAEQKPLAIIKEVPVQFCEHHNFKESQIPVEKDLYFPMYKHLLKKS